MRRHPCGAPELSFYLSRLDQTQIRNAGREKSNSVNYQAAPLVRCGHTCRDGEVPKEEIGTAMPDQRRPSIFRLGVPVILCW